MQAKKIGIRAGIWALLVGFLVGCASSQPKSHSSSSSGTGTASSASVIKKTVVKGKTTQADIVQYLGSPNIVTKNPKGNEVWTYTRQPYNPDSGGFGGGVVLYGGDKVASSSKSTNFDIVFTFDRNDVVDDYSIVSSQF